VRSNAIGIRPLEVVGTREKLRELIVFIAPDADTPLDKVRRGHALCCGSSGMTQDATQLGIGRASVYGALVGSCFCSN